jgi:hypothetical protein
MRLSCTMPLGLAWQEPGAYKEGDLSKDRLVLTLSGNRSAFAGQKAWLAKQIGSLANISAAQVSQPHARMCTHAPTATRPFMTRTVSPRTTRTQPSFGVVDVSGFNASTTRPRHSKFFSFA